MGIFALALELVVVALSYLTGAGFVGGPLLFRVALAFFALFAIPGLALERLFFRPAAPEERAARVFLLGLAFASTAVCAGFIPRVAYGPLSAIASAAAGGLAVLAWRRGRAATERETGGMRGGASAAARLRRSAPAAALFALCVLAFAGTGELAWDSDAPDHVSFVRRSLESGTLFPRDSFYREGDGVSLDPRKGLWHPVLSLWTYQSHDAADRVWREVPAFLAFFACAAFLLLARELTGSPLVTWLAFAMFLLLYAGEGVRWLTKLGFGRNVMQVVFWAGFAFVISSCREREGRKLALVAVAAFLGMAYHAAFALLAAAASIGLLVYVALFRSAAPWRPGFGRAVIAVAAGAALPAILRVVAMSGPSNAIHTHPQGMLVFSPNLATVDFAELATRYGFALVFAVAMAPFFFLAARRTERRGLVFMLFLVPAIVVFDPLIASWLEHRVSYLFYRVLDAAPLTVMLALLVAGLGEILVRGGRRPAEGATPPGLPRAVLNRVLAAGCLALFALYPLRTALPGFAGAVRGLAVKSDPVPAAYRELFDMLSRIPPHAVIASDPMTSYLVSAFTDHFVTVTLDQHGSPSDTLALTRLREARDLMSPVVPPGRSAPWLESEGAHYVLLNLNLAGGEDFFGTLPRDGPSAALEKFRSCPSLASEVWLRQRFWLYGIHSRATRTRSIRGLSVRVPMVDPVELGRPAPPCPAVRNALPCDMETGSTEPATPVVEERLLAGSGVDVGCGIVAVSVTIDDYRLSPGDTMRGHLCWMATDSIPFGLPIGATVRIETDFPKGKWFRPWYGKQYRRFVERRNGRFYRQTWEPRVVSGFAFPDQWTPGKAVRQDFELPLSPYLAGGSYEMRVKVRRLTYLPNRTPADYLSNDDSLEGVPVGMIFVQERSRDARGAASPARGAGAGGR